MDRAANKRKEKARSASELRISRKKVAAGGREGRRERERRETDWLGGHLGELGSEIDDGFLETFDLVIPGLVFSIWIPQRNDLYSACASRRMARKQGRRRRK
jgi:hypothetical protein